MAEFYPAGGDAAAALRWQVVDGLRRYGSDAAKVGHAFADLHGLQLVDLQALVAIMSAEGSGHPLTPTALRHELGLSSAGTSYVIDRLARGGHVRRDRDHPDQRVVQLRYTEHGMATGLAFFGPLGQRTEAVMDRYSTSELTTIARFLEEAAAAIHAHLVELQGPK